MITRYETFRELLGYCRLSAAPVGELVLHVFGAASPERIALADRVCAGLQVIEHMQDVGEDYARGRIYLPREDLVRCGECEQITRREAANFYYGMQLLPRPKREAMSAVYAFARRVDDIGDGELKTAAQLALLADQRAVLARVADGEAPDLADPVAIAITHAYARYELPLDALGLLIDGVEHDVRGTRYETFEELLVYCRAVAGSIGRLCLAIFAGAAREQHPRSSTLADDLGVAMQLTNILRDVLEDHARGRMYLPAEELRRFHCGDLPRVQQADARQLIRFQAERAQAWFEGGLRLVELLDGRSASCVLAMTGIYRSILRRIMRDPAAVLSRRVSVPAWEKAWLVARSVASAGKGGSPR